MKFFEGGMRTLLVLAGLLVMYVEGLHHPSMGPGVVAGCALIAVGLLPWSLFRHEAGEYGRGVCAAQELLATGDKLRILRNYGYSCGARDQTEFDAGYQDTIRDWLRHA